MKIRDMAFLLSVIALGSGGCTRTPSQELTTTEAAFGGDDHQLFPLVFAEDDAVPAPVRNDLAELSNGMQQIHDSRAFKHFWFEVSPGGRAVVVAEHPILLNPQETWGVWVWPNWQEAGRSLRFDQYSAAEFISDWAVRLKQGNEHAICYFNAPESLFRLGSDDFTDMYVGEDGRWFGLKHGRVYSGMLDGPDAFKRRKEMEFKHNVASFGLVHDGRILVTSSWNSKLQTYVMGDDDETVVVDAIASTGFSWVTKTGVIGKVKSKTSWMAIDKDGRIEPHVLRWIGGLGNERVSNVSPNGSWIKTWEDGLFPGALGSNWRRVPGSVKTQKPNLKYFRGWLTYD